MLMKLARECKNAGLCGETKNVYPSENREKWVVVGGCPEAEKFVGHIIETVSGTVGFAAV